MPVNQQNNFGSLVISDSVLKDLAQRALEKYLESEKILKEELKKDLPKNIKITCNEDSSVVIAIKTPARFGDNIIDFSKGLQQLIKEEIEKMSEVFVASVDIVIDSLEMVETDDNNEIEELPEPKEGEGDDIIVPDNNLQ